MTTARELMDAGEAKGRAEGKIEGKLEGRREALRHQLRLKFRKAATKSRLARLDSADEATLEAWEERILTASAIDDVLR